MSSCAAGMAANRTGSPSVTATTPLAASRRSVSYTFGCGTPVMLDSAYPVIGSRPISPM